MILTIAYKEFRSFFATPSTWLTLAALQFIFSWFFLARLDAYLQVVQESVVALREEIEGRVPKAIVMLNNARDAMSMHLGRVTSSLTSLQIDAGKPKEPDTVKIESQGL